LEPSVVNVAVAVPALRLGRPEEAPARRGLTFDEIYDTHVDYLWRSARRLGVSDAAADDVVQQAFVVVHRRLGDFEGRSSLKTWLFSILLRVVRDHHRSVRRKSPHWHWHGDVPEPDELPDATGDPFEAVSKVEAARLIDELLECLEEPKRELFVLAELEQLTPQEIAEVTGLEPKVIYSRLRAARVDFERAAASLRRRQLASSQTGSPFGAPWRKP